MAVVLLKTENLNALSFDQILTICNCELCSEPLVLDNNVVDSKVLKGIIELVIFLRGSPCAHASTVGAPCG